MTKFLRPGRTAPKISALKRTDKLRDERTRFLAAQDLQRRMVAQYYDDMEENCRLMLHIFDLQELWQMAHAK